LRLLAVAAGLVTAPSYACDPGPIFVVRVESADTPECLVRTSVKSSPAPFGRVADSSQTARIRIRNDCTEPGSFSAKTCDACGPGLTLAPGGSGELVLESRGQGDAVDYGQHTKQVWTWTLGSRSGNIATDVTVTDDTAACEGKRSKSILKGGCSPCHVSTPRRRDDPWTIAGLVAVFALAVARRWARA
jgi:hypothetical protein